MSRESGFTLVELLVTIVMVGITSAAVSSIFVSIRGVQAQVSYHDTATRAATWQVESLRNDSYDTLVAGTTINFTSNLPASLPKGTGTAVISAPTSGLRRVDATVTYKAGGQTKKVTISSLIGEIGITQ